MAIKKSGNTKGTEISYEVIEECGGLGERENGYEMKLRYMKWNGGDERYDLRAWKIGEDGKERCTKGITLSGEELEILGDIIAKMKED